MNKKSKIVKHLCYSLVFLTTCGISLYGTAKEKTPSFNCAADAAWFTSPSMPTEVKKSGSDDSSNFCDFYQFSWQAFAYLMSPSAADKNLLNFEDAQQYPELEVTADGEPANSCDESTKDNNLFVRMTKSQDAGSGMVIPERIGQAGGGATIYDQGGNVVYYDVRFSRNMCDVNGIKTKANFPGGTTELKSAWKVLASTDNAKLYITMDAKIGGDTSTTKLGLIGFHIAAATPDHPEMVWATFEHKTNAPDCVSPTTTEGWSFASKACTENLKNEDVLGTVQCRFNNASAQHNPKDVTGSPTEICREYAYGSAAGDPHYDENVGSIKSLNSNVQPHLKANNPVLTNYFNVGALWVSDTTQSSTIDNQRGSLRLANTVAETDYQSVDTDPKTNNGFASNCFGCHNYVGTSHAASGKNTTSGSLSHIFDDIAIGSGQCLDVQSATVINSQSEAEAKCPTTCSNSSSGLEWNGQWTNQDAGSGAQLPMTVCGCCGK